MKSFLLLALFCVSFSWAQEETRREIAARNRAKALAARRAKASETYRPTRPCNVGSLAFLLVNPQRETQFSLCQVKKTLQDWLFVTPTDVQEFVNTYYDTFDANGQNGIELSEMNSLDAEKVRPYRREFQRELRIANPAPFVVKPLFQTIDQSHEESKGFLRKDEVRDYLVEKSFNKRSEGIHDWIILAAFERFDNIDRNGKLNSAEIRKVLCEIKPIDPENSRAVYFCQVLSAILDGGDDMSMQERLVAIDPSLAGAARVIAAFQKRYGGNSG